MKAEDIIQVRTERLDRYAGLRMRMAQIRALVEGRWDAVYAGEGFESFEPLVRNIFRHTIEDGGRLFAEAAPTERVPAAGVRDEARAEEREIVLSAYTARSGAFESLELHGQDLIACGFTVLKVWPNFSAPPAERFPHFRRLDPFRVLPEVDLDPSRPTDRVLVCYRMPLARLAEEFPDEIAELVERIKVRAVRRPRMAGAPEPEIPTMVEVADYYSSERIVRVALYETEQGTEAVMLLDRENETRICPVQIAVRPSWSSEPLGDLDDSRGPVRLRNRYWRLLLDYFVDMVYGGKLAWNVRNPEARGPGVIYHALGPDARMDPVTPSPAAFGAFQVLSMLDEESRTPTNPPARYGEVELNKATAAFLSRAQGPLSSVVRSMQRAYGAAKRRANEAAFAQDEAWCNTRKRVIGAARGRRRQVTYTPSELIRGDYANVVSYGSSSGVDAATHQVLVNQKVSLGLWPIEKALEEDPSVDDVGALLAMRAEQQIRDAVIAGLSLPDTPLQVRAEIWRRLRANRDRGLDEALEAALEVAASSAPAPAPAPAAVPPGPGAPPGVAGVEGVLQGLALPPLGALRARRR